jgi:conjugative relaxase-like TrwC/TraI family protein
MLFIEPRYSANSLKQYYTQHLTRDDYYTRGEGNVIGKVSGRAAELLDMPQESDREMYFRLIDGQHPMTGEWLGGRAVKGARIAYEVTADMPKAGTLAYRLGGDKQIRADYDAARDETLQEMESGMCTRVRKGGQDHDRVTANIVYFTFPHHVTRNLDDGTCDPQEHDHIIIPNKTYDPVEEEWKAGQFGNIKTEALYFQAALHARTAKRWADRGYAIERDGKSFRILGIDQTLVDKFSRRTKEIEEEATRQGITDAKKKSELGRKLRNPKKEDKSLAELTAEWKERCTAEELRSLKAARGLTLKGNEATPEESCDYAIAHCFQKEAVVSEKRLWAEALMHGVGSVTPEEIKAKFKERKDLIYSEKKGIRYATTPEWRQAENKLIAFPRDGRGTCKKLWTPGVRLDPSLDAEQRTAAEAMLNSRDRVILLVGAAGAGKTYTMNAVRDVIEKGGKWGGAFALSTQASRKNLREAGFPDADTVARLVTDEKLQRSLAGKVVFIDEFGLKDVKLANTVFDLAKRHDWRLIIAGDAKQHGPVEGSSALHLIERHSGLRPAQLLENRRQQEKSYRAAVDATRRGNELTPDGKTTYLQKAIDTLDKANCIIELPKEELYPEAAREYLGITLRSAKGKEETRLMSTTTHAEGAAVVKDIRAGLRESGRLTGADHTIPTLIREDWSEPQRGQAVNYHPGLVIQFDQNAAGGIKRGERFTVVERKGGAVTMARANGSTLELPLGKAKDFEVYRKATMMLAAGDLVRPTKNGQTLPVKRAGEGRVSKISNGDVYRVSSFTKQGHIVCDNGFVIPKDFGHLKPGDTITSFSSQSRTVDHVRAVITESAMNAANLEQFYVTLSRGRKTARIYTDNKAALLDAVKHSSARMSATDLLGVAERTEKGRPGMLHRIQSHAHTIRRASHAFFNRGREIYQQLTSGKERGHAQ